MPFPDNKMLLPVSNKVDNLLIAEDLNRLMQGYGAVIGTFLYMAVNMQTGQEHHTSPKLRYYGTDCMMWQQHFSPRTYSWTPCSTYSHCSLNNISHYIPVYTAYESYRLSWLPLSVCSEVRAGSGLEWKQFLFTHYRLPICGCETLHLGTLVTLLISLFLRMREIVWLGDSWESVNWKATETEIELFCCVTVRNEYLI